MYSLSYMPCNIDEQNQKSFKTFCKNAFKGDYGEFA